MMPARQKLWLTLLAILLIVRFALQPWLQWVNEKTAAIQQLQFNIARLNVIDQRAAQLESIAADLDTNYAILKNRLLAGNQSSAPLAVALHLDALAKKHHVDIQNRNTGTIQEGDVRTLPVSFFARGNPANIIRLITELEQAVPKMHVVNATLAIPNVRATQLNANLSILVYLQPEDLSSATN